jgi:hypothetical protein
MRTEYCHDNGRLVGVGSRPRRSRPWRWFAGGERDAEQADDDPWEYLLRWLELLDELIEFKTEELRQLSLLRGRMRSQVGDLTRDHASSGHRRTSAG